MSGKTLGTTNQTLTAIPGIRVGHAQNLDAATGCTVILCPSETVGGVDQRGGAPGTRETDLLRPMHLVQHVNAVLLTGGSAFGLAAADGVMRYLEEAGIGFATPYGVVPIVPAAVIFDLGIGRADIRPDVAMGVLACQNASDQPVLQGTVGAGTGATIGKMAGMSNASKGGLGSAVLDLGDGLLLAALIVVNAVGDVVGTDGQVLAGVRGPDGKTFLGSLNILQSPPPSSNTNTVIGVIATNAKLDKEQANKLAQVAHNGLAQAVQPAHTMFDGDTLFSLATGQVVADTFKLFALAAQVVAAATRSAVIHTTGLAGLPARRDVI
jgi:L-aminopeptidase/D-esterase-like protein